MQKPELIITLEKELNITFTHVSVEKIKKWTFEKSAEYALNKNNTIVGLRITKFPIKELPTSIKDLQGVEILNFSFNQLTDISVLSDLKQITTLYLVMNQFTDISALKNLTQLTTLYLSDNQLTDILALSHLKQLTTLDLSLNQLTDISALKNLKQITKLYLSDNQLTDILALGHLKQLTTLDLRLNQLTDISALSHLKQITKLFLSSNKLTDISALQDLKQLKRLDLYQNPIQALPKWICDFPNMDIKWEKYPWEDGYITFYNNPLQAPPIEIVKQGKEAIRNYFKKKKEEGIDYLYEAKLILVGEERAGKTTIAKALTQDRHFEINLNEKSTHGIDILKWMIPKANTNTPKDFRFNIWDFGGQDIYHATHQFFLTKRSLYLFLTEARKDLRFDDFYYWLNIINSLGGDSPILAVKNKIDQSSVSNDISAYKKMFPQLINDNLIGISCNTTHENWATEYLPLLNIFKEKMYEVVKNKQIESMGTPLPKTWVKVREAITKRQDQGKNYITFSDYKAICKQYNFDQKTIDSLSQLFHDLGVFLHFQDNIKLRNTIFINHEYVTQGVYQIFDNQHIIDSKGEFTEQELIDILQNTPYEDKQSELLNLCEEFKILFKKDKKYLAPQLFEEKKPAFDWDFTDNLHYKYNYGFMPKGIVSYLIVAMHEKIYQHHYWRYGAVFQYKDSYALVEENRLGSANEINIMIRGTQKNELLNIICDKLNKINSRFTNLKVKEEIGCCCKECTVSEKPYFFSLTKIEKAIHRSKPLQCQESLNNIELKELLGYFKIRENMNKKNKINISDTGNIVVSDVNNSDVTVSVSSDYESQPKDKPIQKKKILIIESQPNNLTDTEANNGISGIVEAWKGSINREAFEEPKIKLATNKIKLLQILYEELPDILHFSLHTDEIKGLIFRDTDGNKDYMDKNEFQDTIKNLFRKKHLDLVFVNSCTSSVYTKSIKPYVNYAIGMKDLIPPEVANLFATEFYKNFFTTKSVEDAFKVGKHALKHDKTLALPENIDIPKHKIPKLYKQ